jgi:hypothetical protein
MPGGLIALGDKTATEVRMPEFWKEPEIGQCYIFFTTRKKNAPSQIVGGPQGFFQISPWPDSFSLTNPPNLANGRIIVPQTLDSDELTKNNNGKMVSAFVSELKLIVGPKFRAATTTKSLARR